MSNIVNLNFDDGIKELTINGDSSRVIRWNPSDVNFIDDFMSLVHWMENDFQNKLEKSKIENMSSDAEAKIDDDGKLNIDGYEIGTITKLGNDICLKIDEIFGAGSSDKAFGGANPMTPTPTGPLFVNFITALAPVIEDSFDKTEAAVNKYKQQSNKLKNHSRG